MKPSTSPIPLGEHSEGEHAFNHGPQSMSESSSQRPSPMAEVDTRAKADADERALALIDLDKKLGLLGFTLEDTMSRFFQQLAPAYVDITVTGSDADAYETRNQTHMAIITQPTPDSPLPPAAPRRLLVLEDFLATTHAAAMGYLRERCTDGVLDSTIGEAVRQHPSSRMPLDSLILQLSHGKGKEKRRAANHALLARLAAKRPDLPNLADRPRHANQFSSDAFVNRSFERIVPYLNRVLNALRKPNCRLFRTSNYMQSRVQGLMPDVTVSEAYIPHVLVTGGIIHNVDEVFPAVFSSLPRPNGLSWCALPVEHSEPPEGPTGHKGAQVLFAKNICETLMNRYDEALVHVYTTPDSVFFGVVLPVVPLLQPLPPPQHKETDLVPYIYILSPLLPVRSPELPLLFWFAAVAPLAFVASIADYILENDQVEAFRNTLKADGFSVQSGAEIRRRQIVPDMLTRPGPADNASSSDDDSDGEASAEDGSGGVVAEPLAEPAASDGLDWLAETSELHFDIAALGGSGQVWNSTLMRRVSLETLKKRANISIPWSPPSPTSARTVLHSAVSSGADLDSHVADTHPAKRRCLSSPPAFPPTIELHLSPRLSFNSERAVLFGKAGGTVVICKYGEPESVAQEACWVGRAGPAVAPTLYGVFEGVKGEQWCLVQSYVGKSLEGWQGLNDEQKVHLYDRVTELHERGGIHGDLAPRNVVVRDGRVKLIDFGEGSPHECKGEEECWELEMLRKMLGMGT